MPIGGQQQSDEYRKDGFPVFQQLIRSWKSLVETRGGTFYVVTLPNLPVEPFPASVFREEGVEVINLYDCFGDHDPAHLRLPWDESPYRFKNDGHWNEAGNHLAAVCLYRFLEEKAGLPPLSEDGLREALSRYYTAFGGWRPTDLGGGGVSPQTLAGIQAKYQAFDEGDFFEATWRAMRAAPDKRIIEADFDGTRLVYLKEECGPTDIRGRFFLHLTPVDEQDLLKFRRRYDFEWRERGWYPQKVFGPRGGVKLSGDRCLQVRHLPPWPLRSLRTGQYVPGEGRLWAREYSLDQQKSGEAVMEVMPSEKRIIRSTYDVYLEGKTLVYVKEKCHPADREPTFFLQATPVDARVLAPDLRPQGFETVYFNDCTQEVELPRYDIRHIRTGQFVWNEGRLWEGAFTMGPAGVDEGAPKGGLAGKRIIQSDYDVYLRDGLLIYRKERCGPTDTSARFFLHVTPVNKKDLDLVRARYGYANLDFIHRTGYRADAFGCRRSHRLPAYAVRSIKTGQYLPGEEGRLWEGEYSFD